eukprot:2784295-Prymnesium_polylepis.1
MAGSLTAARRRENARGGPPEERGAGRGEKGDTASQGARSAGHRLTAHHRPLARKGRGNPQHALYCRTRTGRRA